MDVKTVIVHYVFVPIQKWADCDSIREPIKFGKVNSFSDTFFWTTDYTAINEKFNFLENFTLELFLFDFNSSMWLIWFI